MDSVLEAVGQACSPLTIIRSLKNKSVFKSGSFCLLNPDPGTRYKWTNVL